MSFSAEALFTSASRQIVTKYVDVAGFVVLIIDYLATLESEVTHMWQSKWSWARFLFFVTRYLPFIDVPLSVYFHNALNVPPQKCKKLWIAESTSFLVGVSVAEAILFLRVYALSTGNKVLAAYIAFQFIAIITAEFVIWARMTTMLDFIVSPLPQILGCVPMPPRPSELEYYRSMIYWLVLANELSVMLMTLAIGFIKYRSMNSPLLKIIYRDGFFYFFVLAAISAGNIAVPYAGPAEYRWLMVVCQRVMHSILSGRMLLHLRGFASQTSTPTLSNIKFTGRLPGRVLPSHRSRWYSCYRAQPLENTGTTRISEWEDGTF